MKEVTHQIDWEDFDGYSFEKVLAASTSKTHNKKLNVVITLPARVEYQVYSRGDIKCLSQSLSYAIERYNKI